jgi:hypothetical protein
MKTTFLIPSAAYIQPNMQTEFGRIPPSFLPLRTGVLLDEQIALAPKGDTQLVLSLPSDYDLSNWQKERIDRYGLEVVRPPDGMSLGASIAFAINAATEPSSRLVVLHGDTLITGLDGADSDRVSAHYPESAGYWANFDGDGDDLGESFVEETSSNKTLSGFFDFADARGFLRALALERYDFVKAVSRYGSERPLSRDSSGRWYDFGRLETYFLSRRAFTSERHFNDLAFTDVSVNKRSSQTDKMRAERSWYEAIPAPLKLYTPTLMSTFDGEGEAGYEIEYLPLCNLSELFVFAALPLHQWRRIARSSAAYLKACRSHEGEKIDTSLLYREKTWARLDQYSKDTGLSLDEPFTLNGTEIGSLRSIVEQVLAHYSFEKRSAIMHGDFCFSNILFDSRMGLIRTIDPRGGIEVDKPSVFGDPDYDVAKLYHSFRGGYDLIIAGHFTLEEDSPYRLQFDLPLTTRQVKVGDVFEEELGAAGLPHGNQPLASTVLLFLSMLPLHADRPDRQKAFLANALRLSQSLEK